MEYPYKLLVQLLKQKNLYLVIIAALFINALIWFLIIWRLPASATWIPLHYNTYLGIDWIGPWIKIIYYPSLGLLILLVNILLAAVIMPKKSQLANWLTWAALVVQFFLLLNLSLLIINYFA